MQCIYDTDMFKLKRNGEVSIFCDKDDKVIYVGSSVHYFKPVSDNSFIIIFYSKSRKVYTFEKIKVIDSSFNEEYKCEFTEFDSVDDITIDDTFILENKNDNITTLYNSSNDRLIGQEDFKVDRHNIVKDENGKKYLLGIERVSLDDITDEFSMLIDLDTLETQGFYSSLQKRYIPIRKNDNTAIAKSYVTRYADTEVIEVLSYMSLEKERQEEIPSVLVKNLL